MKAIRSEQILGLSGRSVNDWPVTADKMPQRGRSYHDDFNFEKQDPAQPLNKEEH
jgi:hypothetical protein